MIGLKDRGASHEYRLKARHIDHEGAEAGPARSVFGAVSGAAVHDSFASCGARRPRVRLPVTVHAPEGVFFVK